MKIWSDFLNEAPRANNHPGEVMVVFLNRFMCAMTGLRYKLVMEGQTIEGEVNEGDTGVVIKPQTIAPIETYVWSRDRQAFKRLQPDVQPMVNQRILARYACDTILVNAQLQQHKEEDTLKHIPRATEPTPAAPPGPSPTDNQGVLVEQKRNARNEPVTIITRPVPDKITLEQLQNIFPKADSQHLQAVADELNTDLAKYKLDTPVRRAHFVGQIKQEAGDKLNGVEENFNYDAEGLKNTFGYYGKNAQEAQEDGRLQGVVEKVEWKIVDGMNRPTVQRFKGVIKPANQENIANKAYGPIPGLAKALGNDLVIRGDGWKYRGRGLKQLTGKGNYTTFNNDYPKYWGQAKDLLNHPELLTQMPDMVRSAVWFWLKGECWKHADKDQGTGNVSDEAIDAVTRIVNSGEYNKHKAGKYKVDSDPVMKRRENVKIAFRYFI